MQRNPLKKEHRRYSSGSVRLAVGVLGRVAMWCPNNVLTGLRYVPRVLVTDKLDSYPVAHRRLIPGVEHRRSKYLNSRVDNSHQPTRQQQRAMRGFHSAGGALRFLSVFSGISARLRSRRHLLTAETCRREMDTRFVSWNARVKAVSVRRWCGVESASEVRPQVQRRAKTTSLCDFVDR
jgi:putative transposase